MVDYTIIKNNLENLDKNTLLVLKDNAYNCGLIKVLKTAYTLGFRTFCVVDIKEALTILGLYSDVYVLILGKEKLIHKRVFLTVEDELDYKFCIENKMNYHLKIKSKMNRFGSNLRTDFYDNDLCKAIYYHIGSSNRKLIRKEIDNFIRNTKNINKPIHIGGSILYDMYPNIQKRVGMNIYKNSKKLYGKIIKIFTLKENELLGYGDTFKSGVNLKVGIVNVGYKDGLTSSNKNKHVYIKGKRYNLLARKCMDYSFIEIDDNVKLNDIVEFLGENINIFALAKQEQREVYEVFLSIR